VIPNSLRVCSSFGSDMPLWFLSCQSRSLLKTASLESDHAIAIASVFRMIEYRQR